MESIRIWLNGGRNYSSGVKLFMQYGKDPLLKRLFSEPLVSDFKKKKLEEAIRGLLVIPVAINKASVAPKAIVAAALKDQQRAEKRATKAPVVSRGWSKDMDEVEKALWEQWKPVFAEMNELCNRVGYLAIEGQTDPYKEIAAGKMALRILDLDDECDEFYNQRDFYVDHGRLADTRPYGEPCIDPRLIPSKLENHKRYVRQYRRNLEKDPSDLKAAKQVKKHQWFVDHYSKDLKKN